MRKQVSVTLRHHETWRVSVHCQPLLACCMQLRPHQHQGMGIKGISCTQASTACECHHALLPGPGFSRVMQSSNQHLPCFQVLQQHEQGSQLSEPPMAAAQAVWAAAALSQPGAIQAAGELGYARLQALLQARVGRKLHRPWQRLPVVVHSGMALT